MRKNKDQNNSEYGRFLCSEMISNTMRNGSSLAPKYFQSEMEWAPFKSLFWKLMAETYIESLYYKQRFLSLYDDYDKYWTLD